VTQAAHSRDRLDPTLASSHKGALAGVCLREALEEPIPVLAAV
jgi:hypothetical protein